MGKKKSVALIVIMVIVLVGLTFLSVASFPLSSPYHFKPLLGNIRLSTDLGGGYYTVYYPEGVISQEEYDLLVNSETGSDAVETYTKHKGIYYSDEIAADDGSISESFVEEFNTAFRTLQERFESKNYPGYSVKLQDDYTIRVEIPSSKDPETGNFRESPQTLFDTLGNDGAAYFADESGDELMRLDSETVKSTAIGVGTDGGYGVIFNFTSEGQSEFYEATSVLMNDAASDNSDTTGGTTIQASLFLHVGDTAIVETTIESVLNQQSVFIGGGFSTPEAAETVTCLINSVLDEENVFDLQLEAPDYYEFGPTMGDNIALVVAIVFGVLILAMAVYSIVCYRGMGLAHVLSFITFALLMVLFLSLIDAVVLNMAGVLAILAVSALLCGFDWYAFKNIADEFATGKTLTASIKEGYKKSLALTIDVHVVLFVAALLLYFVATGAALYMSLILMFGTVISAACSLGVTRFFFYVLLAQPKNKIAFCNFKREETEDE